jgi:hypothetical protein
VLKQLDPVDRAQFAWAGSACRDAVRAASMNFAFAVRTYGVPLKLKDFYTSVERLAWAKENGCPWGVRTRRYAALGGNLEVLKWAREHGCTCDPSTRCSAAAARGYLKMLQWAREHGCPSGGPSGCVRKLPRPTPRLWHGCGRSHNGRKAVHQRRTNQRQSGDVRREARAVWFIVSLLLSSYKLLI